MKTFAAVLIAAAIGVVFPAGALAATLTAEAGLGGAAKPGRWTRLLVSVTATDDAADAELLVSWGQSRLRRPVSLVPGTTRDLELYLRAREARGGIDARLVSRGREIARVTAPVRMVDSAEPFTLCVLPDAAAPAGDCTASVLAASLPRSPRGYEAVDRVDWPAGRSVLGAEQDAALRAWRVLRALDASGDLGLTRQVSRPVVARGLPATIAPLVALIALGYVLALGCAAAAVRLGRARLSVAAGALAAAMALACGAVWCLGRVGSTRAVQLHHVSLLQQLPGTDMSVLTMRALAEFPSFDHFTLRLPLEDAMLEIAAGTPGGEQAVDSGGFPIVSGEYGLAGSQAFAGEAVVHAQPLAITETARSITIENQSGATLVHCRLGRGLTASSIDALPPGAALTAAWSNEAAGDDGPSGPLITCETDQAPVPLTGSDRPVVMHGTTTIAAYRTPATSGNAGD